jgi:hypothetical protein
LRIVCVETPNVEASASTWTLPFSCSMTPMR